MMDMDQQTLLELDQQRLLEVMSALRIEENGTDIPSIMESPLILENLASCQMSLMHLACHTRNARLVMALLKRGEDVNCKTGAGSFPIHLLLCSSMKDLIPSLKILELLFQHNVDIDAQDSFGRTALLLACHINLVPVVDVLIQAGCNVNIVDQNNNSPFAVACRLASQGWYFWNTDCRDSDEDCLDHNQFPSSLICQALLRAGADSKQGTLLPSAILYGSVETVKEFINLGMDVNSMDENRRTPLGCACSTPHIPHSMVKLLLDYGADVKEEVGRGKSKPIILAFVHNSVNKIRLLLSYGATVTSEDMSELVSVSLSKWFLENPEVICEDSEELLSWRLLVKAGFRPQIELVIAKLKKVYLCSSYSKVSKIIDGLLYPLNSLSDICRISIRSQLSPCIDDNIDHLPLPHKLKKFLKFEEFLLAE